MNAMTALIRRTPSDAAPYRALWREVLLLGLEDAAGRHDRGWVGSRDFAVVCALAGFDAAAVRDRCRAGRINVRPPSGVLAVRPGK